MEIPTHHLMVDTVHHMVVPPLVVRRLVVRRGLGVRHMAVLRMEIRLMVRRRTRLHDYLRPAKNARISPASSLGSSIAAKWPPCGITVHR
jgi:hypothetical protein